MILLRSDDWIAVDKPTGLATHAGRPGELGVVGWLSLHLDLDTHVVSRLDRGTSGVLLLARNAAASARAQQIHEEASARKIYTFWSDADTRSGGPGDAWDRDDPVEGKPAHTAFTRIGRATRAVRGAPVKYRAKISRGRRHQIRRHAAASGVPILGDADYGGRPFGRLCLHCAEVRWPDLAEPVRAEDPPSFRAIAGGGEDDLAFALCRDRRGSWASSVSDAYRMVHRDEIPGLPVSLEIYGDWFQLVAYDDGMLKGGAAAGRVQTLLEAATRELGCRGGVAKTYNVNPHRRSLAVIERRFGEPPPDRFFVQEHGLRYAIDLERTQHSGLFLDQRDTRRRVAAVAPGARVANLFAFTCSFSVVAAAHGAEVVFSVDSAKACLRTGMDNFAENGLAETRRGKFIREDARRWLDRQLRRPAGPSAGERMLDMVVCDPPVFASGGRNGAFALEKEWPRLAAAARGLLRPGGVAVFANNHRSGDHGAYRDALEACFASVEDLVPPMDFPRLAGRPPHVRTFWCS